MSEMKKEAEYEYEYEYVDAEEPLQPSLWLIPVLLGGAGLLLSAVLLVLLWLGGESLGPAGTAAASRRVPTEVELLTVRERWVRIADLERVELDTGDLPANVWMAYPVFLEEGEGYRKINAFFRELREEFFADTEKLESILKKAARPGAGEYNCTVSAGLEFSGPLVSVVLNENGTRRGYTFRTDTGEQVELADVAPEGTDVEKLKGQVWYVSQGTLWVYPKRGGVAAEYSPLREEYAERYLTPELLFRTKTVEDREAGLRRTTLDTQGLSASVLLETPLIEGEGQGEQAIAAYFRAMEEDFFSPENSTLNRFWEAASYPSAATDTFRFERTARVRTETDALYSVTVDYDWFLGGRKDSGSDSYTFRADTGALLRLTDLVREQEWQLKELIQSALWELDGGEGKLSPSLIWGYTLNQFEFYVEDGAIFIAFDDREVGPESERFAIRLPVTIKEEYR